MSYNRRMKRALVGTLICGFILALFTERSTPACLLAGALATFLVTQLGPRSIVEKAGAVLTAAALAWLAGPRAALPGQSLIGHLAVWTLAAGALSVYLHPRAE
jgi:hypothetical protein